jgi:hypothetical protein
MTNLKISVDHLKEGRFTTTPRTKAVIFESCV